MVTWRLGEVELIKRGMRTLLEGAANVCFDGDGDKNIYTLSKFIKLFT